MIIVFFHVLYLIGKIMYDNYRSIKHKDNDDDRNENSMPANLTNNKRHTNDPFATNFEDSDENPKAPKFSPPAYIQRYVAVQKVLADPRYRGKIKKVVDFGCSELGFLNHLKNTVGIEEILCVDVDRDTLEFHKAKAIPLTADYLQNRPNPLSVHVYEGSVTHRDKKLANSDAVVAIELIEHLYPDTLMDFPYNVFGYIKPLVAVITTPNADFNVLFPSMGNEFRHWDHKFEWTRQQFEDWANNIVSRYPAYEVSFKGIGEGPSGTEHLGCCSQMAVFSRINESEMLPIYGIEGLFKSVTTQEFPFRVDNRSDEEKILDEAAYHIRRYTMENFESIEEYPLKSLLERLEKFFISPEALREILESAGYAIIDRDDGPAILCPALSTFSDYAEDIVNDEIDIADDIWENEYIDENPFDERNSDNWGDNNVENIYDERWDDEYEIPAEENRWIEETGEEIDRVNEVALEAEIFVSRSENDREFNSVDISNVYDECWDDDCDISGENNHSAEETSERVNDFRLEAENSDSRSLNSTDFNIIEISNVSHVPSILESIGNDALPAFTESRESVDDNTAQGVVRISRIKTSDDNTSADNHKENQNSSVAWKTKAVNISKYELSSSLIKINDISGLPEATKSSQESLLRIDDDDDFQTASICSIYLESSRNEDRDVCPVNITNPSFDCASLISSFEESRNLAEAETREKSLNKEESKLEIDKRLSTTSVLGNILASQPQFTSSPRVSLELRENSETPKSFDNENVGDCLKSVSETSLRSNENIFTPTTTSSGSSISTIRKFFPPEDNLMHKTSHPAKLRGGNEAADEPNDEINSESGEISSCESLASKNAQEEVESSRSSKQRAPETLELKSTNISKNSKQSLSSNCSEKSSTENAQINDVTGRLQNCVYVDGIMKKVEENFGCSTHKSENDKIDEYNCSKVAESSEAAEAKSATPDAPETPPNSWSPEIMDSGYPNSSSTQDMTPEYDLSSISQDRISDSESPSVAEAAAPRLAFIDHADVVNGDLANNNRDDEGNNMMAENENDLDDDLQPLIDVLEDDLENENDIYAPENDFPVWLLRILERGNNAGRQGIGEQNDPDEDLEADVHAAGDAGILHDEGFDSSSSEDETESSEETIDWNASGDY